MLYNDFFPFSSSAGLGSLSVFSFDRYRDYYCLIYYYNPADGQYMINGPIGDMKHLPFGYRRFVPAKTYTKATGTHINVIPNLT